MNIALSLLIHATPLCKMQSCCAFARAAHLPEQGSPSDDALAGNLMVHGQLHPVVNRILHWTAQLSGRMQVWRVALR